MLKLSNLEFKTKGSLRLLMKNKVKSRLMSWNRIKLKFRNCLKNKKNDDESF